MDIQKAITVIGNMRRISKVMAIAEPIYKEEVEACDVALQALKEKAELEEQKKSPLWKRPIHKEEEKYEP